MPRVHAAYPPQSMKELQNLFSSIEGADISQRQKDCLSLYLIQDLRTADDAAFVRDRFMSERDVHEISGFWAMDHGQFEEAVRLFALSGNSDNIAPRVLKLLIMNGRHKEAVRYIQAVDPVLNRDEDIYLRMALYLKIDLLQAMMFQRSFESTPLGDRLWGQFLQYIFQNNSLPKALLALSLTDAEEARLINYCQTTGSRSCLEFMVTYFVHRGRIAEALEFLQSLGRHVEKRDAVNRVETDLTIVRNFELILPVVQRIAQQVGVSDVDLSRPVPLSASLNIRSSCLTNVDAQSMLIKALRSALALSKTVTVPDSLPAKDDTFEILPQMDDSILDISSVYSEEGQSMVSSELPDTLDEMTDSRPNSPTPSGLGDQSMFSLREESVVSEQEDLPHLSPLMQSAPPPSSYLGRMSASFARPPSPTLPYQTPITHQPQSQQSAYRSPEMMGSLYEEQVQRVKSPVGPSVPQAPPMTSMSPFSPQVKEPARVTRTASRVEKHKRSTRKRSTSPVRKPPTLQSRLTEVANDLNTPTRRSGRIAAKQQATHETDDRSGETGASVTRKRAKVLDDDAHHNVSTTTPAVATHGTTAARSTRTKTAASNAARAAEPPTATRSRRRTHEEQHEPVPALTKSRSILKASEPSSAAKGLRERNTAAATPARLTRTATAVKKAAAAQELDALINDDDGPMRLEDLLQQQQTPAPKRGARKKDQENATEEKPGRKSTRAPTTTTPAAPAPKLARSVVTRRMAKQLEREGQL
ncbi:nuclear pore complex assembly-domain-containing protein [Powellomyces hirtus]|nr:nuclear pore complex assembly-domain-containing protein [Powellomyces hirtus]